ncbi:MAG: serine protease [Crocosphaera sp.]|nr:serine protease [Crocosphaera sp.]
MTKIKKMTKFLIVTFLGKITLLGCSNSNNPANFTVSINGKNNGSGFIVQRQGNTHFVLTSRHVIGNKPSESIEIINPLSDEENLSRQEDPYTVTISDNKTYEINYATVKKDPNLDLAFFSFNSENHYPIAHLSTAEIKPKDKVYIYGFKACNDSKLTKEDKLEKNQGFIKKINIGRGKKEQGYSVFYSNPTITGMSGSPVLNNQGEVIAIHGEPGRNKKAKDAILRDCLPLDERFANNWGISMKSFAKSTLAQELKLELKQ